MNVKGIFIFHFSFGSDPLGAVFSNVFYPIRMEGRHLRFPVGALVPTSTTTIPVICAF